ncbi:MAG TPA: hypothetical protein VE422_41265 [Terriglobia bacterium]|nr:hypothetical protein [Terriglobia bacterium]
MEIQRFGVKVFVADPSSVRLPDYIQIFHRWIQNQMVEDHLLIDVHNYSHIHHGPGILLVAHEGNFSMDMADGRPGLLYYRKTPTAGTAVDQLTTILNSALQACRLLEGEGRFRTDDFVILANDRLNTPNDEETFSQLEPIVSGALERVFGGKKFTLTRISEDPKERLTVRVERIPVSR